MLKGVLAATLVAGSLIGMAPANAAMVRPGGVSTASPIETVQYRYRDHRRYDRRRPRLREVCRVVREVRVRHGRRYVVNVRRCRLVRR